MIKEKKKSKTQGEQQKMTLEERLLKRILESSAKSKAPYAIAKAYGILMDKSTKVPKHLRKKIEKIAKKLLDHIERAADESKSPSNIAIALGIVIDKKIIGADEEEKKELKGIVDPTERKAEYEKVLEMERQIDKQIGTRTAESQKEEDPF